MKIITRSGLFNKNASLTHNRSAAKPRRKRLPPIQRRIEALERRAMLSSVSFTSFPIAARLEGDIAAGPDGAIWFTESDDNKIGRITTDGIVSEYSIPTPNSYPRGITAGPDGALWFAESFGNKIGRISTDGLITEFATPTPASNPVGITTGPDGALWFTEGGSSKIGRIDTAGAISEFPLPADAVDPFAITAGPDGALWFSTGLSDPFGYSAIGRITPDGVTTELVVTIGPDQPRPEGITTGPDGALWFTESNGHAIGRVTTAGVLTEYPLSTGAFSITTGPDGALWFTEQNGSFGRITVDGAITEYANPSPFDNPIGIATGPDGAIWVSQRSFDPESGTVVGSIGRIELIEGNSDPTASDDSFMVSESGTLDVAVPGVLANDFDVDGDPLTAAVVAGPSLGMLTLNADGSFTYAPTPGSGGTSDSFIYSISDGQGGIATATATIMITTPPTISVAPMPAVLDTSFGLGGIVTTDFGGDDFASGPNSVVIQPDGKIVVVGYFSPAGSSPTAMAVARYGNDGALDDSFGVGGRALIDLGESYDDGWSVAVQSDGKIVVAGASQQGSTLDFAVARLNSDGSLDNAFDGDGKQTIDFGGGGAGDSLSAVIVQSDGRILLVGTSFQPFGPQFAAARLNSNGSLDNTFDGDGRQMIDVDVGGGNVAAAVVQADGKIVIAGTAGVGFAVVRLDTDGSLDNTFAVDGRQTVDFAATGNFAFATGVALQADGKIVVVGTAYQTTNDFAVARLNSDGSLDNTFGENGRETIDFESAIDVSGAVAVQADGKIVLVGYSKRDSAGRDFVVARLNGDGTLDNSFGAQSVDFGSEIDEARSVAVQPDGKIVAVGISYQAATATYDFAVARLVPEEENTSPIAELAGPSGGVRGQVQSFTSSASDSSSEDDAVGFTYQINWGDGTPVQTVPATPENGDGVLLNHVFTTNGSYTVSVTATDQHGAQSDAATLISAIVSMALQPDPLAPGQTMLVVGGGTGNSDIRIQMDDDADYVKVRINDHDIGRHKIRGTFCTPVSRIVVYGQAGNDDIKAGDDVSVPAWLYGGDGDDRLKGGDTHDVLLGGAGDDLLSGNGGRDLLIGGSGADRIVGNADEDILIAGWTDWDESEAALNAIVSEWTSARSYAQRTANLDGTGSGASFDNRLNGNYFLTNDGPAATVHDDGVKDTLTGSSGRDWYFANLVLDDGDDADTKDKITDLSAQEFSEDLDFILGV